MATTVFPPRFATAPRRRVSVAALAGIFASWRYAGGRRDLRFDLLRGLAVIAMIADHVGGQESWLYTLTGGNRFWVSAAEGFVCISGLVMGIVYPAVIARGGIGGAVKKAMRRAGTLYLLTVALTLSTAALAYTLQLPWAPHVDAAALPGFVVGVLTLHRAFYLTDVLLLYTLLIVIAAGAIYLLGTARTWIVLTASWSLWGLWQIWPQQAALPWTITDNGVFQLSAWQLLFFNGLVIGFHRKALAARFGWLTGSGALLISGALFASSLAVYNAGMAPLIWLTGRDANWLAANLFSKSDERIGRVIAFTIFALFVVSLVTNLWRPLYRGFGWLLLPLGQNALLAYGLHLFVISLTTLAGPHLFGAGTFTAAQNAALQASGIVLIWAVVVLRPCATACLSAGLRLQPLPLPVHVAATRNERPGQGRESERV